MTPVRARTWLAVVGTLGCATTLAWGVVPAGRFTVVGDTVVDNNTHLTWQRTASAVKYPWAGADSYCNNGSGWRLPTIRELRSLVDPRLPDAALDPVAFPNAPFDYYWSSTIATYNRAYGWVTVGVGTLESMSLTASCRVRCVQ